MGQNQRHHHDLKLRHRVAARSVTQGEYHAYIEIEPM